MRATTNEEKIIKLEDRWAGKYAFTCKYDEQLMEFSIAGMCKEHGEYTKKHYGNYFTQGCPLCITINKPQLEVNESIKPIQMYKGYWATSFGRIWSDKVRGKSQGRWISQQNNRQGYKMITVTYEEKGEVLQKKQTVHKLVMNAFLGLRPSNMVVNHKDGNKENNNINNLEYVTQQHNCQHAFDTGLREATVLTRDQTWNTKITERDFPLIMKRIFDGERAMDVADSLGMHRCHLTKYFTKFYGFANSRKRSMADRARENHLKQFSNP